MRYAAVEGSLFVSALIFIACSGGPDQGPVAGPGPGPTEPGEGVERGDNPFAFLSNGANSSTNTTDATTSTGSGPCVTCNDLLNGVVGQEACPGSDVAIAGVVDCACTGDCSAECVDSFCAGEGLDAPCVSCMAASCANEIQDCQEN